KLVIALLAIGLVVGCNLSRNPLAGKWTPVRRGVGEPFELTNTTLKGASEPEAAMTFLVKDKVVTLSVTPKGPQPPYKLACTMVNPDRIACEMPQMNELRASNPIAALFIPSHFEYVRAK